MERAGFSRLTEASAGLAAPDRALLNLWINRGLDDPALAQMTGMTPEAIASRRARIVERLSSELGLPTGEVTEALGQIAASSGGADARRNGDAPAAVGAPSADPPEPAGEQGTPRFPLSMAIGVAALVIVGIVVGLALALGGSHTSHRATAAGTPTSTTAAGTPTSTTVAATPTSTTAVPAVAPAAGSSRSRPARRPARATRRPGLPRGIARARGSVFLAGNGKTLRLKLTVRGLPAARSGHYEVWLYNSVRDSRALGRLRTGRHRLTVRLPRGARRYRWIDISFQPLGFVRHSGASVLRAADPDRASRRELRRRGARRSPLRRATIVSATARHHRRQSARRATAGSSAARHRHARSAHRRQRRRATRGSAKARRSK
jgi:hypothetical protein